MVFYVSNCFMRIFNTGARARPRKTCVRAIYYCKFTHSCHKYSKTFVTKKQAGELHTHTQFGALDDVSTTALSLRALSGDDVIRVAAKIRWGEAGGARLGHKKRSNECRARIDPVQPIDDRVLT